MKSKFVKDLAIGVACFATAIGIGEYRIHHMHAQSMTFNGVPMQTVSNVVGFAPLYQADGTLYGSPKCMATTVSSNTSGQWSVNYAAVGFTSISTIQVQPLSTAATAAGAFEPTIVTVTNTGASGSVVSGSTLSLLGLFSLTLSSSSTTMYVWVCGT